MQRATKKAAASLDTILTPGFVDRALESNPLEILNNEALQLEHLFGGNPRPEFEAYHNPYSESMVRGIINKSYGKTWSRVLMCVALRKDIPETHALHHAIRVHNKKLVKNIVKAHPQWADWNYLQNLYGITRNRTVTSSVVRFYDNSEWEPLLEFFIRSSSSEEQIWQAISSHICSIPHSLQNLNSSADYCIGFKVLYPYPQRVMAPENYEVMARFLLYNNGLRSKHTVQLPFMRVYDYISEPCQNRRLTAKELEPLVKWVLGVCSEIDRLHEGIFRDSDIINLLLCRKTWCFNQPQIDTAIETVLLREYNSNGRARKISTKLQAVLTQSKYSWFRCQPLFRNFLKGHDLQRLIY